MRVITVHHEMRVITVGEERNKRKQNYQQITSTVIYNSWYINLNNYIKLILQMKRIHIDCTGGIT